MQRQRERGWAGQGSQCQLRLESWAERRKKIWDDSEYTCYQPVPPAQVLPPTWGMLSGSSLPCLGSLTSSLLSLSIVIWEGRVGTWSLSCECRELQNWLSWLLRHADPQLTTGWVRKKSSSSHSTSILLASKKKFFKRSSLKKQKKGAGAELFQALVFWHSGCSENYAKRGSMETGKWFSPFPRGLKGQLLTHPAKSPHMLQPI